jgi:DNA-binding NarL/FixJ family response regulator
MKPIRLLVVDDHALFRSGLISLLKGMPEFQVVGEASNGREAVDAARQLEPDVVLLDVNMPVMGGVEAVSMIKDILSCRILMLTISKNDEDLFGSILAGADGYLLKNATPEELRKAIVQVYEGMGVLAADVTRKVMGAVRADQGSLAGNSLSAREMEVLRCLAQGMTTTQISSELFISDNTVKTHVRHIMEKLEAANRAEAVSKAVQMGLIGGEQGLQV